jgi:hypothetical protein
VKRALVLAAALLVPAIAHAFCGFYVAGSGEKLFNDATQVVLMRMGTRTVLAMQNDYKGPPENFAMVVPVPVVLQEADVKTLGKEVFAKVEQMGAPRLVEYWEMDPCQADILYEGNIQLNSAPSGGAGPMDAAAAANHGVTIEAQFTVGEYKILILSAKDSTGLETWLRQEKYQIPKDAEPLLRPYVEGGMKFFVAKVDPAKVKWEGEGNDKRAALSPLRFHYDADEFALPIRLGLANSSGKQDLIVNILAPNQRYQVTNYKNVTIPTNIDVKKTVKDKFGEFYAALFDKTLEKNPGAVITEYAWQATTCDPCPGPTLDGNDFATLGADVLSGPRDKPQPYHNADFVLTRLHARYGKEVTDDLRFKVAEPIVGGREHVVSEGKLEEGSRPDSLNNFQGRYAIRYAWEGPIKCDKPIRNRWGGPPNGQQPMGTQPATKLAFAKRGGIDLPVEIAEDVPELGLAMASVASVTKPGDSKPADQQPGKKKTGCCDTSGSSDFTGLLGVGLGVAALVVRRRRPGQTRRRSS